jgi:peptidoglycan hydrolase CwlO-like protein
MAKTELTDRDLSRKIAKAEKEVAALEKQKAGIETAILKLNKQIVDWRMK